MIRKDIVSVSGRATASMVVIGEKNRILLIIRAQEITIHFARSLSLLVILEDIKLDQKRKLW